MGAAVCFASGTEIAHWLFCTKNTTGALNTAAKFHASCTSPSEVAPSPMYTSTHSSAPSIRRPIAYPTAWSAWDPTGTEIIPKRSSFGSYVPPCHVARWNRR